MPAPIEFNYDVFMSHNSADKPRVRRLAERLKAAGCKWKPDSGCGSMSGSSPTPTFILHPLRMQGLELSRVLLLVPLSQPATLNSQPACTAVHREPANAGRRFIPLLLGDCALPDMLRRYKVVDFREESEAAIAAVLTTRSRSSSRPKLKTTNL